MRRFDIISKVPIENGHTKGFQWNGAIWSVGMWYNVNAQKKLYTSLEALVERKTDAGLKEWFSFDLTNCHKAEDFENKRLNRLLEETREGELTILAYC